VLWSGDKQIDQAFDVIKRLVSLGKQVFFISNSSGKTREDSITKIKNFGYEEACPE